MRNAFSTFFYSIAIAFAAFGKLMSAAYKAASWADQEAGNLLDEQHRQRAHDELLALRTAPKKQETPAITATTH